MMSKKHKDRNRNIGLDRPITRRDLLHGISLAGVSTLIPLGIAGCGDPGEGVKVLEAGSEPTGPQVNSVFAPENDPDYYPPIRTGLRGSHAGSFETAHAHARQGQSWTDVATLDESYDLIVVGGGISGLTAAFQYLSLIHI